ncbi:MAG: hypothetical protein K8U57_38570 [Planctomycetes bacterium]|nr:hypothetical protein [Planctomycetota bacterium]
MAPSHAADNSEPDHGPVSARLRSDNYTVAWGTPLAIDPGAELEVGRGGGHGGTLSWIRFRPGPDEVEVLSVKLDEGWHPYHSKWPPDRAPVATTRGRIDLAAYVALLNELAMLHAATVRPVPQNSNSISRSTTNFWVQARLASGTEVVFDLDWAGYYGSDTEVEFAKALAMTNLTSDAVERLELRPYTLTAEERGWVSDKFVHDWARFAGSDSHWWVRERYLITVGVAGDAAALPALRDILAGGDSVDRHEAAIRDILGDGASDDRCVYYAINAVTRLVGTDVREWPVEEMDTAAVRPRVLALLDGR